MTIFVKKVGSSKRGPFCTFICDFGNGFVINSIASLDGVEVKEETKYDDLYLEQQTFDGKVRYTLHKK